MGIMGFDRDFQCDYCGRRYDSYWAFIAHTKVCPPGRGDDCPNCRGYGYDSLNCICDKCHGSGRLNRIRW